MEAEPTIGAEAPAPAIKTVVVGLYGLPGAGKSHLLAQLKQSLAHEPFKFLEGSDAIAKVVPGGMPEFHTMSASDKQIGRGEAITKIQEEASEQDIIPVVAGHYMFWYDGQPKNIVWTSKDLHTYTHIIYLYVEPNIIAAQRASDTQRDDRPTDEPVHLALWQYREVSELRQICYAHGILFSVVKRGSDTLDRVSTLLQDFSLHDEKTNQQAAFDKIERLINAKPNKAKVMLVLDADKTLAVQDTGVLFWQAVAALAPPDVSNDMARLRTTAILHDPLKSLFSAAGHSYVAFRQAMLMYEDQFEHFESICKKIASTSIDIHGEFITLLNLIKESPDVDAVVVTSGIRNVWEKALTRNGLSHVAVIGGGQISDGVVVTPILKSYLVARLQSVHNMTVIAFGDSTVDIGMLHTANEAIVAVGPDETRSKSIPSELLAVQAKGGLQGVCEISLPANPLFARLDGPTVRAIDITSPAFITSLIAPPVTATTSRITIHEDSTSPESQILASPMRNAACRGSALRAAHGRAGQHFALTKVTHLIGMEPYPMVHVQGDQISGMRLRHEAKTLIVAIMRGGEPMALGVSDAFPLAAFLHASGPADVTKEKLAGKVTVILVDSVINSGRSLLEMVLRVRELHASIKIVVVAGVVQEGL